MRIVILHRGVAAGVVAETATTPTAHRQKADKSETEADIAEITSGGVSGFNAEITANISELLKLDDEDSQVESAPIVLFTFSNDSQ